MAILRSIGNFIHAAGSKFLNHPFNAPLDRYFLLDEGSVKAVFVALTPTVFPIGAGTQTATVNYSCDEEDYTELILLKNGEPCSDGTPVKGTFTITVSESSEPIEYQVQMKRGSKIISTSKKVIFEYVEAVFYGYVAHVEDILEHLNEEWIEAHFTRKIASPSNIVITNLESNYELFTFITPKSYGDSYSYIGGYDNSSMEFDYTNSFTKIAEVTIDSVVFNIYIIDIQAKYANYTFRIVF